MSATDYGEIIIYHINHRLRGGVARMAMSRARFSRRNSIRNAHLLLSTAQHDGDPIVLPAGSHLIPSFPGAAGHL